MPYIAPLSSDVDQEVLKQALEAVVERHEALRTVFATDEFGKPYQIVVPNDQFSFELGFEDVSHLENKQEAVAKFKDEDLVREFDLSRGPLFRVSLIRVSADNYLIYCNLHHIITCLLYTSPSPRDSSPSRMPSSA